MTEDAYHTREYINKQNLPLLLLETYEMENPEKIPRKWSQEFVSTECFSTIQQITCTEATEIKFFTMYIRVCLKGLPTE